MQRNRPNYVPGYQPHPGSATYYYQDPAQYMYYSAPGAMGGSGYTQYDCFAPQAENFSQFNNESQQLGNYQPEEGYASSSSHGQIGSRASSNNQRSTTVQRGSEGHRGGRHNSTNTGYRGGHRGNNRAQSHSHNSSENGDNYQRQREFKSRDYTNNSQPHNNDILYGQGYYKEHYINRMRSLRSVRYQNDQSHKSPGLPSRDNVDGQRGSYRNSTKNNLNGHRGAHRNSTKDDVSSHRGGHRNYNAENVSGERGAHRNSTKDDVSSHRGGHRNYNAENVSGERGAHRNSNVRGNRRQGHSENVRSHDTQNSYDSSPYRNNFRNSRYIGKRTDNRGGVPSPDEDQERATQLRNGTYECNVCMDKITQKDPIWSCSTCFNSFHLACVTLWIKNSLKDEKWRCPACNSAQTEKTVRYFCFCKKVSNPHWNRRETPHSCGQLCKKKRSPNWCVHGCPDLCHPGACPPCAAFIKRKCACGKSEKSLRCSDAQDLLCDNTCDKLLNCGVHRCTNHCHTDDCQPCDNIIKKSCYCGKSNVTETCTEESVAEDHFSCAETCGRTLSCEVHTCGNICHSGECMSCEREVSAVTHCPCGKKSLLEMDAPERKTCSDPILKCGKVCGLRLKCGLPGSFHTCGTPCHEGPCPPCLKVTPVKCRCGSMKANIPCVELKVKADEVTCKKACKKLRHCGRHKCGLKCCIDEEHLCTRKCGQFLSCKTHRCEHLCHRGKCNRCLRSGFDELTCHCGYSIMNPPIPCGTEPPACDQPCVRTQACEHVRTHKCHQGVCPPCTLLVPKPCCGGHKTMKNTPCYVSSLSCGAPCEKTLSCGVHKCQKVCHEGVCQTEKKCSQKCRQPRQLCGHECGAKCHKNACPDTPCKLTIIIQCICGNRRCSIQCSQNEKEFQATMAARLASQVHATGETVDLSALFSGSGNRDKLKRLECDDECKLKERNQRLALALQITNPESRDKLGDSTHLYSDLLKEDAKRDYQFTSMVHDQLSDLVLRARESTQKNRSYSFAPMNREKRRFIHEYSKHFGCESRAYDEEPKKNVVVTATKGLCYLPPVSLSSIVQRETGNRKVPGPYLNKIPRSSTENSLKKLEKSNSQEKRDEESPSKPFDYFDME